MWPNPQEIADLVTFTKEIFNGKLNFCAVKPVSFRAIYFCIHIRKSINYTIFCSDETCYGRKAQSIKTNHLIYNIKYIEDMGATASFAVSLKNKKVCTFKAKNWSEVNQFMKNVRKKLDKLLVDAANF